MANWEPTREMVEAVTEALINNGAAPGNGIHSWRCEHPDMYGPCECVAETVTDILSAIGPLIAQRDLEVAAQAWDEGYSIGLDDGHYGGMKTADNPYRAETEGGE